MAIKYWVGTSATNRTATWNPAQAPTFNGPWSLTPGGTVRTTNPLVGDTVVFPNYAPLNSLCINNFAGSGNVPMNGLEFYGTAVNQISKTCTFTIYGNLVGAGTNPVGQNPWFSSPAHRLDFRANGSGPTAPAGDRYYNWGSSNRWGGSSPGTLGGANQLLFRGNNAANGTGGTMYFQSALSANLAQIYLSEGIMNTGGYSVLCSTFARTYATAPSLQHPGRLEFLGGTITCTGNGAIGTVGGGYLYACTLVNFTSDSSSYGDVGGIAIYSGFPGNAGVVAVGYGPGPSSPADSLPVTYYNNPAGTTFAPNFYSNVGYFSNFSFGGSYANQINRSTQRLYVKSLNTPTGFSISNLSINVDSSGGIIDTGSLTLGNATFNGAGGNTSLGNTLTISGNFSLLDGNINLKGKNLNIPTFASVTTATRGVISTTGIGNISPTSGNFFTDQGTFTTDANVIINMPGGGVGVTLTNNSNVGNIQLASGSVLNIKTAAAANVTIRDITTSVRPANINMSTTGTFNLSNLSLAGNAGNVITFQSNSGGTQFYVSKSSGTITANFLNIKDSNASGGASWLADNGTNSNGGNNTGWVFTATVAGINGQFFVFF
jgi:hypothetical protein